ncbi:Heme-regulated inhibitor 1 [Hyphodiscus hymeniophilus]|uniref:non-specific serine/threonine protein kinase n=1 Tax=Hyphodiscus hymeniophilus TaxID=353542 RepID=A0A9P6VT31_9HELO|nr:Heme-regulated inhibitor 1 [Hyphodiscus hymeniophilus]
MTSTLQKAGLLPDEFAGQEFSELRKNYLSSFDAIIQNIAAKKAYVFEGDNTYSSLFANSNHIAINKDLLSASTTNAKAFALQQYPMAPGMLSRLRSLSIQDTPYRKQYKEQCLLGKGGFGHVYKAFHTLDGRAYAIKKVVMRVDGELNPEEKAKQMVAEIRALSRLDHRNIVRYHHCWTENLPAELLGDSSGSVSEEETSADVSKLASVENLKAGLSSADKNIKKRLARDSRHQRQVSRMQGEAEDSIIFANSTSVSATPGKAVVKKSFFRSPKSHIDIDSDNENDIDSENKNDNDSSDSDESVDNYEGIDIEFGTDNGYSTEEIPRATEIVKKSAVFDVVLFIQMSLHPMNLEDYLWPEQQKRAKAKVEHCHHCLPTARILLAILDGVDYIHRHKIVHRDLKPPNIMLSVSEDANSLLDGSIKVSDCSECSDAEGNELYITPHIGDFGLVAEIQDSEVSDLSLALESTAMSAERITLFTPSLPSTSTFPTTSITRLSPKDRFSNLSSSPIHSSAPGLSTRQPGTRYYVAPRSSKGKDIICPRVDVYSLGVIALEMVYKFNTRSERAFELDRLKDGCFPQGFEKHRMASGIKSMLCPEREQRWGCAEVRKWLNTIIETETKSSVANCE